MKNNSSLGAHDEHPDDRGLFSFRDIPSHLLVPIRESLEKDFEANPIENYWTAGYSALIKNIDRSSHMVSIEAKKSKEAIIREVNNGEMSYKDASIYLTAISRGILDETFDYLVRNGSTVSEGNLAPSDKIDMPTLLSILGISGDDIRNNELRLTRLKDIDISDTDYWNSLLADIKIRYPFRITNGKFDKVYMSTLSMLSRGEMDIIQAVSIIDLADRWMDIGLRIRKSAHPRVMVSRKIMEETLRRIKKIS